MGLFDKDFMSSLGKLGDAVKEFGDSVDLEGKAKELEESMKEFGEKIGIEDSQETSQVYSAPATSQHCSDIRADMPAILAQNFAGFVAQSNVSAASLGWMISPCQAYDYCLYNGSTLVGCITFVDHNRDRNTAYLNARRACEDAGVPFINFYTHMTNDHNYVVARINRLLA